MVTSFLPCEISDSRFSNSKKLPSQARSIRSEFERTKFVFCMSKYPGANFAREFGRKRNAKPISFSARRNFGLRRKSVRSSKLCPLGEIVLKAKIVFQKVLGEIHFTQDLVWVKLARRNAHTKHEFPAKLIKLAMKLRERQGEFTQISGSISEITNSV